MPGGYEMRILSILIISLLLIPPLFADDTGSDLAADSPSTGSGDSLTEAKSDRDEAASRNREVILYGTDVEILSLTEILKESGDTSLDTDLARLLAATGNAKLQEAVYDYFLSRFDSNKSATPISDDVRGLIDSFSLEVLSYWDQYRESIIERASRYLGQRQERKAIDPLLSLLEDGSPAMRPVLVRVLGQIGGEGIAAPLIAWLERNNPSSTLKNEIYRALGSTQDREHASPFILASLEDEYASPTEKMALLDAAGALEDPSLLPAMLVLLSDADANVRASVVASLGAYVGEDVDRALLDAFRDNFYKTRIAAAKAVSTRKLEEAIPYLIFRAQRDSVMSVQLAAIDALSNYDTSEIREALSKILTHDLKGDAVRAASARALLAIDHDSFIPAVIEVMETAVQGKKQKPLYHELARFISIKEFEGALDLASRLIVSPVITDRHYALNLIRSNRLGALYPKVKELDTGKTDSLARKARLVREALEEQNLVAPEDMEDDEENPSETPLE